MPTKLSLRRTAASWRYSQMPQNGVVTLGAPVQDGQVFVVKIMHGANLTEKAKEEVRLRMLLYVIDCIP